MHRQSVAVPSQQKSHMRRSRTDGRRVLHIPDNETNFLFVMSPDISLFLSVEMHFRILSSPKGRFPRFHRPTLTQTTGLSFPFQQTQDVSLTDRSLDVADDGSSGGRTFVGHELDSDLGDVTGVTGASQHPVDLGKLDWLILRGHITPAGEDGVLLSVFVIV
jgi:hypothetical protein